MVRALEGALQALRGPPLQPPLIGWGSQRFRGPSFSEGSDSQKGPACHRMECWRGLRHRTLSGMRFCGGPQRTMQTGDASCGPSPQGGGRPGGPFGSSGRRPPWGTLWAIRGAAALGDPLSHQGAATLRGPSGSSGEATALGDPLGPQGGRCPRRFYLATP